MAQIMGHRELCRVTGKEIHTTKQEGKRALAAYGHRKGSKRVQWCPFCEHYHMTSRMHARRERGGR
jgi:hypothetical protein